MNSKWKTIIIIALIFVSGQIAWVYAQEKLHIKAGVGIYGNIPWLNTTVGISTPYLEANSINLAGDTRTTWPAAGVTDHGALTGLEDDDHTQYVLRNILTTHGDLFFRDGTGIARLAPGTSGQFLSTSGVGANPTWADVSQGSGGRSVYNTLVLKDDSFWKLYASNGTQIGGSYTYPDTAIEAGLLRGGICQVLGLDETWICDDTIDSQKLGVILRGGGLNNPKITIKDALNKDVILNQHDYCGFEWLHLHGNRLNQGDPSTPYNLDGIRDWKTKGSWVRFCHIEEIRRFGVWTYGVNADKSIGCDISHNNFINCQWNGIQAGGWAWSYTITSNYVENFADVGITVFGWFGTVTANTVRYIDMTGGAADSAWGYGAEEFGEYSRYNTFDGNTAIDCHRGMCFSSTAFNNEWSDGIIVNLNVAPKAWGGFIWMQGNKNRVKSTLCADLYGTDTDVGVLVNGNDNEIENMKFVNTFRAISCQTGADNNTIIDNRYFESVNVGLFLDGDGCWVDDNNFVGTTTAVTDNGSWNDYGHNRGSDKVWDSGIKP